MSATRTTSALQTAIFVAFGVLKACKPSEAFLTPYLIENKHLTKDAVNNQVYPVFTYSYFLALPLLPYVAERFGYRRIIYALEDTSLLATRFILIFGVGLAWMQSMQVTFAIVCASQIVYFSYAYRVFSPAEHQKMTALTRAGVLLGHCVGSAIGQVLVSVVEVDLAVLFYISASTVCLACCLSLAFPSEHIDTISGVIVDPEHQEEEEEEKPLLDKDESANPVISEYSQYAESATSVPSVTAVSAHSLTANNLSSLCHTMNRWCCKPAHRAVYLKPVYASAMIFALSTAHLLNIEAYASTLWYHLSNGKKDKMLNGAVDCVSRTAAALGTLFVWFVISKVENSAATHSNVRYWLCLVSYFLLVTPATFVHAVTGNVWVAFAAYAVVLGGCGVVTSAMAAELCEQVRLLPGRDNKKSGGYVVALGSTTFLALGVQSLMQLAVSALEMGPQDRFWVYSGWSVLISILTVVPLILSRI